MTRHGSFLFQVSSLDLDSKDIFSIFDLHFVTIILK